MGRKDLSDFWMEGGVVASSGIGGEVLTTWREGGEVLVNSWRGDVISNSGIEGGLSVVFLTIEFTVIWSPLVGVVVLTGRLRLWRLDGFRRGVPMALGRS